LIWWVEVVDMAGNSARGTGLSEIDPMNTVFTVLSFDLTVTNIEIALADGSIPRGNEVVEGTEIGVVVQVRNLGTKTGTVRISLMEDMGGSRNWLSHGEMDLTIAPGQSLQTIPLLFETYGTGPQNLYVNLSGMDVWIDNSILPHCAAINGNATCDIGVESDMPRVVSQDGTGSGIDGMALTIGIMALLLIGASFVIVVLIRRDNSDESIFYDDDDDDWEEDDSSESEESEVAEVTPILPPMAPEKAQLESAAEVLESNKESAEVAEEDQQNDQSEESEDATSEEKIDEEVESKSSDPWTDVEHSD
jgi:hypothetical protein